MSSRSAREECQGAQEHLATGAVWGMPVPISLTSSAKNHVCLWINRLSLTVTTLHRDLAKAERLQHHHKLILVVPAQPMRPELRVRTTL